MELYEKNKQNRTTERRFPMSIDLESIILYEVVHL